MTEGVILALGSAAVWGSGDYCGGRAATRFDPFQVLGIAAMAGIVLLAGAAVAAGEPLPGVGTLLWSAAAGVGGACGIVALYRGLAVGSAATVAPLAAVMAAVLPVVLTAMVEGAPGRTQLVGFGLAFAGIWLAAHAGPSGGSSRLGAQLGLLAGVGFGAFLILIAQVEPAAVYVPLAVARLVMLVTALAALGARRLPLPSPLASPISLLAGLCDAGGNIMYLLARQQVRLDVAAVLTSLYPVATVVLARVIGHEPVTRLQWLGAAVCLLAVALIAV